MAKRKTGTKKQRPEVQQSSGTGHTTRTILILFAVVVVSGGVWWLYAGRPQEHLSASKAEASGASFKPTVENAGPPPADQPPGMVWIPGGEFSMGAADQPGMNDVGMQATVDSRPIHRVYVDGFWMDTTEVTNAQFAKFVDATGYVTIAERRRAQKTFLVPRPRISWPAPSSSRRPAILYR